MDDIKAVEGKKDLSEYNVTGVILVININSILMLRYKKPMELSIVGQESN